MKYNRLILLMTLTVLGATGCVAQSVAPEARFQKGWHHFKTGLMVRGDFSDYEQLFKGPREKTPADALIRRPVEGRISSRFGMRKLSFERRARMHSGIDFAAPKGTPIVAASSGQVVFVGWRGAYGKVVEVDHGQGVSTLYAHMDRYTVKNRQKVQAGAPLGQVGNTGRSTGPHLHFELRIDHKPLDPLQFVDWA